MSWIIWFVGYALVSWWLHAGRSPGSSLKESLVSSHKYSPWLSGFMLAMVGISINQMGLVSGIMSAEGWSGMWLLWTPFIGAGFFPLIFAPLWRQLDFVSENEFILVRYAGAWSRRLFHFRAWYVGGLVVALILAMLAKASMAWFSFLGWSDVQGWCCTAALMLLGSFRGSWTEKVRSDTLHFGLVLVVLVVAFWHYSDVPNLEGSVFEKPEAGWCLPILLIFMQWWSAVILDGGGVEAQVIMGAPSRRYALKVAFMQQGGVACFLVAVALIVHRYLSNGGAIHGDATIMAVMQDALPEFFWPIWAIAAVGIFLSTSESFSNWGAGLLMTSCARLWPTRDFHGRQLQVVRMVTVLAACVIAGQSESVQDVLLSTLGLTAGVAPVFFLRWFWWRINAQVQAVAMLMGLALYPLGNAWLGSHWTLGDQLIWATPIVAVSCALAMFWSNNPKDREAYEPIGQLVHAVHPRLGLTLFLALLTGVVFTAVLLLFTELIMLI